MKFFLGSSSPRRKLLIEYLGIRPEIVESNYEERNFEKGEDINQYILELSLKKAEFVNLDTSQGILLTADTLVCQNEEVLGKPNSKEHAKKMLSQLSGREHIVKTSFTIHKQGKLDVHEVIDSKVEFDMINSKEIDFYLDQANFMDKAGSYGIQDIAQVYVKSIKGNYSNIVGLPVHRILHYLVDTFGENWRDHFE